LSNTYPSAAISRKLFRYGASISLRGNVGVPTMLKLPKPTAVAIQATLGLALSAAWAAPALADAAPANTATQSRSTPLLHAGDLVRLRSGGPPLTVKSVEGNWVICTWWNEEYGAFQSAAFPIATVDGPVTISPDDANSETNGQINPSEPSVRRSGDSRSSGHAN
jgi:uncharacterized protein YodC (DUF2158 family)